MQATDKKRVIALGASNLTRGFSAFLGVTGAAWGPDLEVYAALGHGRSYGSASRLLWRELPGILQCGIWDALDREPRACACALVTDIGNDLLYGYTPEQTLAWVSEAVRRLRLMSGEIVITDLPIASIRSLSPARFLLFRSLLVPRCRLSLAEVSIRAEALSAGLAELAQATGAIFQGTEPCWYGVDPVHIRQSSYTQAWRHWLGITSSEPPVSPPVLGAFKLALLAPERRRLLGFERTSRQNGYALWSGARLWLY